VAKKGDGKQNVAVPSRRRAEERAERIARGESEALTNELSKESRTGILQAMIDSVPAAAVEPAPRAMYELPGWEEVGRQIFHRVTRAWRVRELLDWSMAKKQQYGVSHADEVNSHLLNRATTGEVRDLIEAWFVAVEVEAAQAGVPLQAVRISHEAFRRKVNEVLDDEGIAISVVDGLTVDRGSMEMHAEIVRPVLDLLGGRSVFQKVEAAYQKALTELRPGGDPSDAITDAGTALQEVLTSLGADGNSLGPLLQSARTKGLLGPYDSKLSQGVQLIGEWLSADRSQRGDAHSVTAADREDAWLAVHVAGALILRLAARAGEN
jgi:hypothetical protein